MPKMTRRLDSLSTFRSRTPTSPQTADHINDYSPSYVTQRDVVPSKLFSNSREATRPMNEGGKPFALGLHTQPTPNEET